METKSGRPAAPQLGSPKLTVCFSTLMAGITAISAVLYCLATGWLSELSVGTVRYALALPVPLLIGVGAALATVGPANRRFRKLRQAFQTIIDGDLSVRLPENSTGIFAVACSDFNRMAQELEKVRTMREEYVNTFTHEFKTPLTAIRGFAELLQEPGFTELEGGFREKGQSLTADIAPVELYGSKELLSHVWTNLIGNAIKYTPNGGQISVSLRQEGSEAVCIVADNGIGMSEEVKEHIFDRYYQADPTHTRKGIGLGLPIVHKILELCGGRIDVESVPNQGSTFQVSLPLGVGQADAN